MSGQNHKTLALGRSGTGRSGTMCSPWRQPEIGILAQCAALGVNLKLVLVCGTSNAPRGNVRKFPWQWAQKPALAPEQPSLKESEAANIRIAHHGAARNGCVRLCFCPHYLGIALCRRSRLCT